jgi:hypothetical protein
MTTLTSPATTSSEADAPARWAGAMKLAAGSVLVAGPVLWGAGMFFSPQAESMSDAHYIASLARDYDQTQISAMLLHYANLFIGVGILAAPGLVRGARGLALTVVGALATALGLLNISGLLLADWWNAATGLVLSEEQAVEVFQHVKGASLMPLWTSAEAISMIGLVLVLVGLCRAGVLAWWSLALFVGGWATLMAFGATLPLAAAAGMLVGMSPFGLVGVRLLQRHRLRAR